MKPLDPRVLPHLRPAAVPLAVVLVCQVLGAGLLVWQVLLIAGLIVQLVAGDLGSLGVDGALLVAVTGGRGLAALGSDLASARASERVTTTLRRRLLSAALSVAADRAATSRLGEVSLLLTRGVAAVDPYLTRYLPTLPLALLLPGLTLTVIATQDLLSAAIVAATLPLVPVFAVLVGMATRDRAARQWRALAALAGHFVDVMRGLPTLVTYRRATAQSATIRLVTDRYRRASVRTLQMAFASSAVLELVATLSVALVAVVVGLRLAGGGLDLHTALVVLLLAPEAYWPLRRVGAEFHAAAEGTATFEAADELLTSAVGFSRLPGEGPAAGFGRALRLENVVAGYPGRSGAAVRTGTVEVDSHTVTAVTGPSGAGKSTLLAVLSGELTRSDGIVEMDGAPVDLQSDAWRRGVAMVSQRPWLMPGTVLDNVRSGVSGATESEVWAALERVGLRDHVASLRLGLAADVGEDGLRMSAGQRARLVLARAVLAQRPLTLVDEPSAHLDAESELIIARVLRWLARRSTVVVVTHSPALVAAADVVVRLEGPPAAEAAKPSTPAPVRSPAPTIDRGAADRDPSTHRTPGVGVRLRAGAMLGMLASASGVALTVTSGWLITRAAQHPPVLMLMVAIVGVRAFGLARPVLRYAERLVVHDAALRLLAERRTAVYDRLVPLVPGRLGRNRGDVLASVVEDVDSLLDAQLRVRGPLTAVSGVCVLALSFSVWLLPGAAAVLAGWLVVSGVTALAVHRCAADAEVAVVSIRAELSDRVTSTLQGARELVGWQAATRVAATVAESSGRLTRMSRRAADAVAAGRFVVVVTGGLAVVAVTLLAATAHVHGDVSAPAGAALVLLPVALLELLSGLPQTAAVRVRTAAAQHRLRQLMEVQPLVGDPVRPLDATARPTVTLNGVSAGWGGTPAFGDLSLELPPGRRVAVVGPSGSGKSTLAALLVRFLDPGKGHVRQDGVDIRGLRLDDVRGTTVLVDDDPHVFSSSVRENLRLARPGARDDELETALRTVSLGEWLDGLPDGLDTMVGDGHRGLSGGERTRLGLARAVLSDAAVLVLDEPTAQLDRPTAVAVARDVLTVLGDRTLVWVTHDGETLGEVDAVLDLAEHAAAPVTPSSR